MSSAAAQQRARDEGSGDEARVVETTLFLHTPGGLGRSELAAQLTRLGGSRTAEAAGTARNWATGTSCWLYVMADAGWFSAAGCGRYQWSRCTTSSNRRRLGRWIGVSGRSAGTPSVISQAQNRSSGTPSSRRASSWSLTAA
jgi:hypothetical protein